MIVSSTHALGRTGPDQETFAIRGADHRRDCIDHLREPFARIAQRLFSRTLGLFKLLSKALCPDCQQHLLLPQLQQVASTRDELLMVDWTSEKIGGASFKGT